MVPFLFISEKFNILNKTKFSMKYHIGPHVSLEKTLLETLSFFDTTEGKQSSLIQTFIGPPVSYNLRKFHSTSYIEASEYLQKKKKFYYPFPNKSTHF